MTLYDAFYWIKQLSENIEGKIDARYINKEMYKLFHLPEKHKSTTFQDGFTYEETKVTVDNKGNIKRSKKV